jgi:ArsR family transcriptional regulator, arsenate/arsenite/antimonite-responsive transcriptional repressor
LQIKILFVILQTTNYFFMAYTLSTDYKEEEIALARIAKAMGHPARIAILKYLATLDTCCFGDINKELPIAKATVSQHLAELKDAGLIKGTIDPPKVNYCIDKERWEFAKTLLIEFFDIKPDKSNSKCC